MILSNVDILKAINDGDIKIDPLGGTDPTDRPFNTTAIDLRLASTIIIPDKRPSISYRLDAPYDKEYVDRNCKSLTITEDQPYLLEPNQFILGQTLERVYFPFREGRPSYAARVEGKSGHARRALLVHFTAPTIHSGFEGTIALEMINLGGTSITLTPNIYICQLIIEQVASLPLKAPNQFSGQSRPSGTVNST